MSEFDVRRRVGLGEALESLPGPNGERYRSLFRHGTLEAEIYAPRGEDPQASHDRVWVLFYGPRGGEKR